MMSASSLSPDPPVDFSLVRGAVGIGLDLRLLASIFRASDVSACGRS